MNFSRCTWSTLNILQRDRGRSDYLLVTIQLLHNEGSKITQYETEM